MAKKKITLNAGQTSAMRKILAFLDNETCRVFVLRGYAGTGKTTLLKFLLSEMDNTLHLQYTLLSPTGRAAKVMRDVTGKDADTVHSMLFSYEGLNKDLGDEDPKDIHLDAIDRYGQLYIVFNSKVRKREGDNSPCPMIYIIDEASMIADTEEKVISQAKFGSGRLLSELLAYDTLPGSKYIFIGDPCQLPPVVNDDAVDSAGNHLANFSPALSLPYLKREFNIPVANAELTEVMRQENGSGLLEASQRIRELRYEAPISAEDYAHQTVWARLPLLGVDEIVFHDTYDEMEDEYVSRFRKHGAENTIFIARSNFKCNRHSLSIRSKLGITGSGAQPGDLLMITQNNKDLGIYNGDFAIVLEVGPDIIYHTGLHFVEVRLKDVNNKHEYRSLMIEDTLYNGLPNLDSRQQTALYADFHDRMKALGIRQKTSEYEDHMRLDPWLNALRCTYGYCVTCNKAQGGEWQHVYIDMPRNIMVNPLRQDYQWVYTALTRATSRVHLKSDYFYN